MVGCPYADEHSCEESQHSFLKYVAALTEFKHVNGEVRFRKWISISMNFLPCATLLVVIVTSQHFS